MSNFNTLFLKPLLERKDSIKDAICINKKVYNYAQLFDRVDHILSLLVCIPDKYVGIYAVDSVETYASIVALWMCGKTYVPLNPNQPKERHNEVIDSVGLKHVLSSDSKYASSIGAKTIYTGNCANSTYCRKTDLEIKNVSDDELAYILFTSGSTGKPKGVQISRENVAAFIESINDIGLDITEEDRCLQPFDLTFDFSVSSYVIPLAKGACFYTIPNKAVKFTYIVDLLDDYKLTVLQMVPSMVRNMLPYMEEIDISSVRYNILCGEALYTNTIQDWHKWNSEMVTYNMYGPTEDTVFCTYYLINKANINCMHHSNNIVSIGTTFKNNRLCLLDDNGNLVETANVEGELCLCGLQLTSGYWKNDKENIEKFFELDGKRYYRSGDLCFYDERGNLMYVCRKDSQVKINGFRVELGEIESLYKEISGKFSIVIPYANKQNNTELAIVIEGSEYDYTEHKKFLASKLPKYELPVMWVFMKSFPLNLNGKIDRKKIINSITL